MIASRPSWSFGGITGSTSVFSWKTKQERSATTSSGSYAASVFSRISSVRMSSFAELIYKYVSHNALGKEGELGS